eukprot:gene2985-5857_t
MGSSQSYYMPAVVQWYYLGSRTYGSSGYKQAAVHFKLEPLCMKGKVVLVTGANKGIGYATAEQLAALGAEVHLVCRNKELGELSVKSIISKTSNDRIFLHTCDLSSKTQVNEFSQSFIKTVPRLDVLINNAGCMPASRTLSEENNEVIMATAMFGSYLLSARLLPLLKASAQSRVINISSGGAYTVKARTTDLNFNSITKYDGTLYYAFAKRNQIEITEMMADRLRASHPNIVVNSMHPGWTDTEGLREAMADFYEQKRSGLRSPEQGADTIVYMASSTSEDVRGKSGLFWFDRRPADAHMAWSMGLTQLNQAEKTQLWQSVQDYCGLDFDEANAVPAVVVS